MLVMVMVEDKQGRMPKEAGNRRTLIVGEHILDDDNSLA